MQKFRRERDSLGEIEVPADRLWGAQTQRSIENFPIGRCHFLAEMELYLPTQSSAEGSLLIACFAVRTEHRGFGKGDEGYFASLGIGQLHAPPGRISTKELASTHESLGHFDCVEASHGNVW